VIPGCPVSTLPTETRRKFPKDRVENRSVWIAGLRTTNGLGLKRNPNILPPPESERIFVLFGNLRFKYYRSEPNLGPMGMVQNSWPRLSPPLVPPASQIGVVNGGPVSGGHFGGGSRVPFPPKNRKKWFLDFQPNRNGVQ